MSASETHHHEEATKLLEGRVRELERPSLNKQEQLPEYWNERAGYPNGIPNGCGYFTVDGR